MTLQHACSANEMTARCSKSTVCFQYRWYKRGCLPCSFPFNIARWSFLEIHDNRGSRDTPDSEIAYIAGKMEAYLTASLMEQQWMNTMGSYCTDNPKICEKMIEFVLENSAYRGDDKDIEDPRWYQVKQETVVLVWSWCNDL